MEQYYYKINDNDVLNISRRIFFLKKEADYNGIALKSIGMWNKISKNLTQEQAYGSTKSILAIRNYLNNK